ncbi:MAG: sulfite exporter TauE/SafE family protein [Pyrinomonadaceae bacterium]|nr:sulfite exporter TauE/SafE family protein [Pyrinomonadaceae bacterium]
MPINSLILLVLLFFITSVVGVVTGSNSLITVPVMFQFGIEPKTAVATNMVGLTFMNIGASLPFIKEGVIDYRRLSPLVLITLIASAVGALLVGMISSDTIPIIVSASMIMVGTFILVKRDSGNSDESKTSNNALAATFILTFFLGVYGGLYSGGYVTMLTAVLIAFYGMTIKQAIAGTKLINVFSSAIASLVFAWQGLIDYGLAIILAVTMFVAAYIGAKTVTKINDVWLKRIFMTAVFLLALKTILDYAI